MLFFIQVTLLEVDSKIQVRLFSYVIAKIIMHLLIGCSHSVQWLGLDHPKWKWVFFGFDFAGKEYETDQVFISNLASTVTEADIKDLFGSIGIIKVMCLGWGTQFVCFFAKKRKERCNWHWSSYLTNKAFHSLNRQD